MMSLVLFEIYDKFLNFCCRENSESESCHWQIYVKKRSRRVCDFLPNLWMAETIKCDGIDSRW